MHLVNFTITVIIHGQPFRRASESRGNAFIVQGFRSANQGDYSIFRTRRKTSFPRFLSNRLAAAGTLLLPDSLLSSRPGLSSAKSRKPDSNFLLNPRLSPIMADSLVVCIEMKCDFFRRSCTPRTNPSHPLGFIYFHSTSSSSLPLPTRFVPLCMPSNWMLIARPVWQNPSLRTVQIRNEILLPLSCGFRVHRCPVYLLFEGDRIYTHTFLLLYHHTEMLKSNRVIILCVFLKMSYEQHLKYSLIN